MAVCWSPEGPKVADHTVLTVLADSGITARMRTILILVLLAGWSLAAQESHSTKQMINGRAWLAMTDTAKTFYVSGVHDSIVAEGMVYLHPLEEVKKKWAERFTVGDHIEELNKLYKDRENILLPVPAALDYCTEKLKGGKSKDELEQILILFRTLYR